MIKHLNGKKNCERIRTTPINRLFSELNDYYLQHSENDPENDIPQIFSVGAGINHSAYGYGIIEDIDEILEFSHFGEPTDLMFKIYFENKGIKKLCLKEVVENCVLIS